jgi:phosphatidylserine/phosphatidylglycerophosphate/cardiolipin synthase-like enzyme
MKTTNFGTRVMVENIQSIVTPLPGQTYFPSLLEAIRNARLSIDIIQYQWNFYKFQAENPVQQLNQLLIQKLRNGLKCRILLNKEGRGQNLMKINMEASKFLQEAGAIVKFGRTFPITHAKLWLIDNEISIVGSHNLSGRSFTVNNEVSVLIKSTEINREYDRYFESIWSQL